MKILLRSLILEDKKFNELPKEEKIKNFNEMLGVGKTPESLERMENLLKDAKERAEYDKLHPEEAKAKKLDLAKRLKTNDPEIKAEVKKNFQYNMDHPEEIIERIKQNKQNLADTEAEIKKRQDEARDYENNQTSGSKDPEEMSGTKKALLGLGGLGLAGTAAYYDNKYDTDNDNDYNALFT